MSHLYVNTSLLPMSTPLLRRFHLRTGVYAASTVSTLPMTRDLATKTATDSEYAYWSKLYSSTPSSPVIECVLLLDDGDGGRILMECDEGAYVL